MRYRLHWADGEDAGEAVYGYYVQAGDDIWISRNGRPQQVRVLTLVRVEEEDSPYEGLLMVAEQG